MANVLLKVSTSGLRKISVGGAWVAQLVECPTLGFGSGHDLTLRGFTPLVGLCTDRSLLGVFSPSLSLSLSLTHHPRALPLSKINKH